MDGNNAVFEFIDDCGTFRLVNPAGINETYFPLCSEAGFMSCITPMLHGDVKTGQHNFLLQPVTVEDLHNTRSARNFWFYVYGRGAWSASGNSAEQNSKRFSDAESCTRTIEAGFLRHKLIYSDETAGLRSEILNFVPSNGDMVEIMHVTLINTGDNTITVAPTSAIPIYGRSADNIRDHRHVTSLINRVQKLTCGISVKPLIIFDERGHRYNNIMYYVLGCEADGTEPVGSIPVARSFTGKAGSFDWPEAIVRNTGTGEFEHDVPDGKECIGALRFRDAVLGPGEKREYIILMGICKDIDDMNNVYVKYNSSAKVLKSLDETAKYWVNLAGSISFESGLGNFSNWMKWVGIQPVLRKIFGCSFLPYHDYGRGGRGWRDLWQDCLSFILVSPAAVKELLYGNFGGVRLDGTNATIIGKQPGEFTADRNGIARVWMDHGAWPYLAVRFYIDMSGDFDILFEDQVYFTDALVMRAAVRNAEWTPEQGTKHLTEDGRIYRGSVLEHILVQHLVSFFNVGGHNIIRLEGGDWNDTLDMARDRGESTAFTALYGSNLIGLSELLVRISEKYGAKNLELLEELSILLDSESEHDYNSVEYKKALLDRYLRSVSGPIPGRRIPRDIVKVAEDLEKKGKWIYEHARRQEWIELSSNEGFFNGYYNNDGIRVDGCFDEGVRMNLTAQVFTCMYGLASKDMVRKSYNACRKYLKDPVTGGYRLNTDPGPNKLNFGRGFAFVYGEKENGSVFCHMVVMYINALYKRGFVNEGYEVFKSLYELCMDMEKCDAYPGIPEYFSPSGKGMYHYLTGSASWLLLTVLTQMYGIRGEYGKLVIEPKLTAEQFGRDGTASASAWFKDRRVRVFYYNAGKLDYPCYRIVKACINGKDAALYVENGKKLTVCEPLYEGVRNGNPAVIEITLAKPGLDNIQSLPGGL